MMEYSTEYYESRVLMLWIWIMLWLQIYLDFLVINVDLIINCVFSCDVWGVVVSHMHAFLNLCLQEMVKKKCLQ